MNDRRLALALALASSVLACGGHESPTPEAPPELAVRLASAERLELPSRTTIAGTVTARRSTAVASRVAALVTAVRVELGQQVAAGQSLVEIDPTAAQGQAASAQGALAQAEAGLALARRNHERFQALAARQAASELEVDQARAQYEQALGAVEQARGSLAGARSVARESSVVAPFAGRVTEKMIEVGDMAAPGRPLVRLESVAGRRLTVAVPERVARDAALALGQRIPVAIDARSDLDELDGEVVEISPGPDPQSHAYTVVIDLGDAAVPAGAAARAFLPSASRQVVAVPQAAIVEAGGLLLVVVRGEGGAAQSRVVTLGGPLEGERVEVLSGLAGGETVALGLTAAPPAGALLTEAGP